MAAKSRLPTSSKPSYGSAKYLSGVLITLLIITFASCRKENEPAQINGKWKGTMSIWKRTTFMNGSISSEGSDTTDWTKPGYSTSLDFSGDSVALYYEKPNYTMDYYGLKFVFAADKIQFYNNPFSYRSSDPHFGLYTNLPLEQSNICYVAELTSTKLVLYDKDTINRSPIIVWQQWNTFIK